MDSELIRVIEAAILFGGVAAIFLAVLRYRTTSQTILAQKELIETLSKQVDELRTLHIDNEKAISKLQGQVDVYKEIPLSKIATSLDNLDKSQLEIVKLIKKG